MKSLVPANVISGFKTCGIYPFDPQTVLDHDPCDKTVILQTIGADLTAASTLMPRGTENGDSIAQEAAVFTKSEEALFARQFSDGYDLTSDPKYLRWFQLNHPEESDKNLSDYFSDVPPAEPLQLDTAINLSSLDTAINLSPSSPFTSNCKQYNADDIPYCDVSCGSTDVTPSTGISTRPISPLVNANKHVSIPEQSALLSYSTVGISSHRCDTVVSNLQPKSSGLSSTSAISKYLVQYVAPPPAKKNTANTRVTGSRVLANKCRGLCNITRKRGKEREGRKRKKK